jgi:Zn-dependent protease with chaperone function
MTSPGSSSAPRGGSGGGQGGQGGSGGGRRRNRRRRSGSSGNRSGSGASGQGRGPASSSGGSRSSGGDRGGRSGGGRGPRGDRAASATVPAAGPRGGQGGGRREAAAPAVQPAASAPDPAGVSVSEAEIAANRRRARMLAIGAGVLPGLVLGVVLGVLTGPVIGAVVAIVVVAALAVVVSRTATDRALRQLGGHPVDGDDEPRLANLVEGLCATFGVPRPRLWLVEDPVPNACALGRRPSDALVVVTSGLLERLGLIETEGVVAHELAHVKRHDTTVSEVAVAVLSPLVRLTGNDRLVHAAIGRGREYRADEVAAATVRYPPGLHDALEAMTQGPEPQPGSVFTGRRWAVTRWLWVDPMVGDRDRPLEGELDATPVRSAALAEW